MKAQGDVTAHMTEFQRLKGRILAPSAQQRALSNSKALNRGFVMIETDYKSRPRPNL